MGYGDKSMFSLGRIGSVMFGTTFNLVTRVGLSGVTRAFPGGRLAHDEEDNR